MSALDELRGHAEELHRQTGIKYDIVEENGRLFFLLHKVPLPPKAYKIEATDVLFITDKQYPLSAMDMFWTEPEVLRSDGSIPQSADSIEQYLGRSWRRFSWHRNGIWNPAGNPLLDHFALMEDRFARDLNK